MKKTFFVIDRILIAITLSLFILLLGLMTAQIILRYVFSSPIRGVIIYCNLIFTWLAYLACAFVARDKCDLKVDYFIEKFPIKIVVLLNTIYKLCPLALLILLAKPIYDFYEFQRGIIVAGVGFSVSYFTYAFVIGFTLIAIYTLIRPKSDIESLFMGNDSEKLNH